MEKFFRRKKMIGYLERSRSFSSGSCVLRSATISFSLPRFAVLGSVFIRLIHPILPSWNDAFIKGTPFVVIFNIITKEKIRRGILWIKNRKTLRFQLPISTDLASNKTMLRQVLISLLRSSKEAKPVHSAVFVLFIGAGVAEHFYRNLSFAIQISPAEESGDLILKILRNTCSFRWLPGMENCFTEFIDSRNFRNDTMSEPERFSTTKAQITGKGKQKKSKLFPGKSTECNPQRTFLIFL